MSLPVGAAVRRSKQDPRKRSPPWELGMGSVMTSVLLRGLWALMHPGLISRARPPNTLPLPELSATVSGELSGDTAQGPVDGVSYTPRPKAGLTALRQD